MVVWLHFLSLPTDKAPPHEINNFWEEMNLMKKMEPHSNVVNLLGHCTSPGIYYGESSSYNSDFNLLQMWSQLWLYMFWVGNSPSAPCCGATEGSIADTALMWPPVFTYPARSPRRVLQCHVPVSLCRRTHLHDHRVRQIWKSKGLSERVRRGCAPVEPCATGHVLQISGASQLFHL